MLVVLALGGNALLRRGEPLEAHVQRQNVLKAVADAVAPIAREHQVVVTHGNGPQIGLLALQTAAFKEVRQYPLDVLGAESEGMIGYLIEQALVGELPGREVATLLTQVEVDPADPGFANPTKPIGPVYEKDEARQIAGRTSWTFMRDGSGYRRAVPSPLPRRIREINVIKLLVRFGILVICAGGGGIPVVVTADGALRGVEGVIDKDSRRCAARPRNRRRRPTAFDRCRGGLDQMADRGRSAHWSHHAGGIASLQFRSRLHGPEGGSSVSLRRKHRQASGNRRSPPGSSDSRRTRRDDRDPESDTYTQIVTIVSWHSACEAEGTAVARFAQRRTTCPTSVRRNAVQSIRETRSDRSARQAISYADFCLTLSTRYRTFRRARGPQASVCSLHIASGYNGGSECRDMAQSRASISG